MVVGQISHVLYWVLKGLSDLSGNIQASSSHYNVTSSNVFLILPSTWMNMLKYFPLTIMTNHARIYF